MKIATWNVNSIKARLDFVSHWLASREPDVVMIQELKLPTEKFPREALQDLGYFAAVHGQPRWNGVAILSKTKPVDVVEGLEGTESLGARVVQATIGDTCFVSVYVPNGKTVEHPDYQAKLTFLRELDQRVQSLVKSHKRVVVGGDFNVVPEPLDSHHVEEDTTSIFHTEAERALIKNLKDVGLHDLFRHQNGSEKAFSWWDYRAGAFHKKKGLRIDFLFATDAVAQTTNSCSIDRDYRKKINGLTPSDHAPVIAELSA